MIHAKIMAILNNRWTKLVRLFVCVMIMITASVGSVVSPSSPTFIKVVGWVGILFFGLGGMYAFVRYLRYNLKGRNWVLILEEGVRVGATLVRWENIVGFGKLDSCVQVFTNNVEERLAEASLFKRWNIRLSMLISKTDIIAPKLGFEGSCDDFIARCEEHIRCVKNEEGRIK